MTKKRYREIISYHFNIHTHVFIDKDGQVSDTLAVHFTPKTKTARALMLAGLPTKIRQRDLAAFSASLTRTIDSLDASGVGA